MRQTLSSFAQPLSPIADKEFRKLCTTIAGSNFAPAGVPAFRRPRKATIKGGCQLMAVCNEEGDEAIGKLTEIR